LTRVAVILHERLGNWNRQLRPRLHDRPIRWLESRSSADLESLLTGLACPVVLIDLGEHAAAGLEDLERVLRRAPDARVLVIDPAADSDVAVLARELGAAHVASDSVPPALVARLVARWVELAQRAIEHNGWSRTSFPETSSEPWGWLADLLGDPRRLYALPAPIRKKPIAPSNAGGKSPRAIAAEA
jgi:DNA-binding NtrC family response regulator